MSVDVILNQLSKVRQTGDCKWFACCPAHDDKSPSLSIRETSDGTVLLKCFAGCDASEIVESVGLNLCDLFSPSLPGGTHSYRSKAPRISWREVFDAIEWNYSRLLLHGPISRMAYRYQMMMLCIYPGGRSTLQNLSAR